MVLAYLQLCYLMYHRSMQGPLRRTTLSSSLLTSAVVSVGALGEGCTWPSLAIVMELCFHLRGQTA